LLFCRSTETLNLGVNKLTGAIPSEIGRLTTLKASLYLDDNDLTGTIPTTLGSLVLLEDIFLRHNALEGPIPTELAQCQNLKSVSFRNNTLTGDVGPIINMLPRSLTLLELSINIFSGTVPTFIGTLTNLNWLDLGGIHGRINLNGTIPTSLGLLTNLKVLALNSNRLTGSIPTSLGSLSLLGKSQSLSFQYSFATIGSHVCTFSLLQRSCTSMTMF
jgi:Leucine-rich repeat (LRR) protein